ncbi:DUF3846 domain-containing protein [Nocardia goodfellowii]
MALIKPGQAPEKVEISGTSLNELYQLLECEYVKELRIHDDTFIMYDEDAKDNGKPRNPMATELLQFAGGRADDFIAGSFIITGVDDEGEMIEADLNGLMDAVENWRRHA